VQACKEGHLQVSGEILGYCADSNKRQRDLPIHGYETNLDLLVDVTVVSSLQNVEKAADSIRYCTANRKYEKSEIDFQALCC
jgi:hypothetical protein